MFKRAWKQIKILIILIVVLICLPHSILPLRSNVAGKEDIDDYIKINQNERRLSEFRDNDEALKLKIEQIDFINKSRKRNNASPVKLDILASRVANKMAKEAAENEYIGHWNMAGEEPYLRYAFAGGHDHVSENAYGEWTSGDYNVTSQTIAFKMKEGHEKFMAEHAPYDGHKQTIIEKAHNFVGIGYYLSGKQFRYYEEFLDRYLEFEDIPAEAKIGESFNIKVTTTGQSYLYYLIIYRQEFPKPLSAEEISKKGNYMDYTDETYKEITAWELSRHRNGSVYTIPLSFTKKGLYYIQIFSDKKEITKPSSLTTKGKTPESGIVIKVTEK
jgi:uncharacterized protein YkwD